MEFFRISRTIPFMRHVKLLNLISLTPFVLAIVFIVVRGFNLSIEFTGGTVMEVQYPQAAQVDEIREALTDIGYTDFQVQNFGTSRDIMIRLPTLDGTDTAQQSEEVMGALSAQTEGVVLQRAEFVGPQVGERSEEHTSELQS